MMGISKLWGGSQTRLKNRERTKYLLTIGLFGGRIADS